MRHRVADLDGPVHYIDFGRPAERPGTPLLMVHGLGGNALNWMAVGPALAETYHALAIDLAGFGQTPLFGRSATVGAQMQLVHAFISDVIGKPAFVMGNSMGGHVSILEAAEHPESVTAMVLVDPAIPDPHVRRPEPRMLRAIAALSVPGLAQTLLDRELRSLGPEVLVRRALELVCADPSRVDPRIVEAHVQLTREREHLGPQSTRAFLQATRSIGFRMADPRFWSRVEAVKAATLIIHGSLDRVIPVAAARELHRRRTDWELKVIEGVGHVPMLETPDLFIEALHAWTAHEISSAVAAS